MAVIAVEVGDAIRDAHRHAAAVQVVVLTIVFVLPVHSK